MKTKGKIRGIDPATISLATLIIQALIQYGPDAARTLKGFFEKADFSPAAWEELFRLWKKPYSDYIRRGRGRSAKR